MRGQVIANKEERGVNGAIIAVLQRWGAPQGGRSRALLLLAALMAGVAPAAALAAGQLMVAPTRVVFSERDHSATINLINSGDETTSYRIDFVNKRMTDNGDFQEVDTPLPGERFSDGMIRFSPRLVELPPGKSQTIRLLLRKPADLEPGEYRSHMHFKALPPESDKSIEALGGASDKLTIQLTPVIGVTIPVIVRHGQTEAQLTLDNLRIEPGPSPADPPILSMSMKRQGNRSVYGDITTWFKPAKGEELVVGKARGVAVYTPNPVRNVRLNLQPPAGLQLKNGTLRVTFEEGGSGGVATEASTPVH